MCAAPRPPFDVALARVATRIPEPGGLPGGVQWDGFRAVLDVTQSPSLWSRQRKDLTRHFPDLMAAAEQQLPHGVVLDGEAVIWSDGRLDFGAMQRRLTTSAAAITRMVRELPASYVAFDVLAVADTDVRHLPLRDRRRLLEQLAAEWSPPLELSPATRDRAEAAAWFEDLPAAGLEGIVAKGLAEPYEGGKRQWVKVKHRETIDVVCGAVIGPIDHPREVVVGLHLDGQLRIAGRSSALSPAVARELAPHLREPIGTHPWPETVTPGTLDRFNSAGRGPVTLTLVEPLVVEVSADTARTGHSFRHAVRFVRARPDLRVSG